MSGIWFFQLLILSNFQKTHLKNQKRGVNLLNRQLAAFFFKLSKYITFKISISRIDDSVNSKKSLKRKIQCENVVEKSLWISNKPQTLFEIFKKLNYYVSQCDFREKRCLNRDWMLEKRFLVYNAIIIQWCNEKTWHSLMHIFTRAKTSKWFTLKMHLCRVLSRWRTQHYFYWVGNLF